MNIQGVEPCPWCGVTGRMWSPDADMKGGEYVSCPECDRGCLPQTFSDTVTPLAQAVYEGGKTCERCDSRPCACK